MLSDLLNFDFARRRYEKRNYSPFRDMILPLKGNPHSRLHKPGELPFWMQADAISAQQGAGPVKVGPENYLRILQDTGHELWLYLSHRGLEIRSLYRVPLSAMQPHMTSVGIFCHPFKNRHAFLELDCVKWDILLPASRTSNHLRLVRKKFERKAPGRDTIRDCIASDEEQILRNAPVIQLMLQPGVVEVDMYPVKITVRLNDNRSTDLISRDWHGASRPDLRHISDQRISQEASRLSGLVKGMTLRQRLRLFHEKRMSASNHPAPFPAPGDNLIQ